MLNDKALLRQKLKEITVWDKDAKDDVITKIILGLSEYKSSQNIYVFKSLNNEPSTKEIIENALNIGKNVYLPITSDIIRFCKIDKETVFDVKKYGVLEPKEPNFDNIMPPDFILVPMVGYDLNKGRLGHGKGYYDRFLEGIDTFKVGVSYSDYQCQDVFCDKYDVKMDIIITDKGIL